MRTVLPYSLLIFIVSLATASASETKLTTELPTGMVDTKPISTKTSAGKKQPKNLDHIYNEALLLEQQVLALRRAQGISQNAKKPPVQTSKLLAHVYAKYLEVEQKIVRLQNQLGMAESAPPIYEFQSVTRKNIVDSLRHTTAAMEDILDNEMADTPAAITTAKGKSASNAYEKLWEISYLFDDMLGPANSSQIYSQLQHAQDELKLIAQVLSISPKFEKATLRPATATDSNLVGFRNMYKLAKIERLLQMDAVRVSDFPVGKISPSDTLDTSNNIMVELGRIKGHLGIDEKTTHPPIPDQITPSQVLQAMEDFGLIAANLISQLEQKNAAS